MKRGATTAEVMLSDQEPTFIGSCALDTVTPPRLHLPVSHTDAHSLPNPLLPLPPIPSTL